MASLDTIPTIGIITTYIESAYWTSVVSGASDALRELGASVVCFTLGYYDPSNADRGVGQSHPFFEIAGAEAVDGLIVPAPAAFAAGAEAFFARHKGLPMISVGQVVPGIPSVVVDNAAGTKALLRYLIDKCRFTRIAYIRGPNENAEARERYDAYVQTLKESGIPHDEKLVAPGEFLEGSGARAAHRILGAGEPPQAIVAANDLMALGALRALRQKGLLVPRDVAVAGFDDIEAVQGSPALTTVRQPAYDLGRSAAELVMAKLRGESVREKVVFPAQLVLRESTPVGPRSRSIPAPSSSQAPLRVRPIEGVRFVEPGHSSPAASASQKLIKLLREEVIPHLSDKLEVRGQIDGLLRQIEGLVQEAAREAESFQRAAESAQAVALLDLRRRSARAASLGALMDDLSELLPALSMDAVYLALYDRGVLGTARLVLAWEGGRRIPLRTDGLRFEPRTLLPTSLRRRGQQTTSVAQPLQLGGRQLGYMLIRGQLYDAQLLGDVCQLLSNALARFELN